MTGDTDNSGKILHHFCHSSVIDERSLLARPIPLEPITGAENGAGQVDAASSIGETNAPGKISEILLFLCRFVQLTPTISARNIPIDLPAANITGRGLEEEGLLDEAAGGASVDSESEASESSEENEHNATVVLRGKPVLSTLFIGSF